ncbi:mis18-binding protein 1 [Brachionichthys hirsutus]|uniref:mis18-binding protein 1 n=1 Tax=Brachionichthys hirsutus TaxID=412623 RepID=UPI0036046A98
MASYQHLRQHTQPRFESPAKVFAKLKAKVQREMCAYERTSTTSDPRCQVGHKRAGVSSWVADGLRENERFGSYRREMQPLTISPTSSPQKSCGRSCSDLGSRPVVLLSPLVNRGRGHAPRKTTARETAHMFEPRFSVRDSDVTTRNNTQPVLEENGSPVKSSAGVYTPMRNRLRKRAGDSNNVSCLAKGLCGDVQAKKPSSASFQDESHNDARLQALVPDGETFTVRTRNHLAAPPSAVKKRCFVALEQIPSMSPAKTFAFMKERESRRKQQQEVQGIGVGARRAPDRGHFHRLKNALFADHNADEAECKAFPRVPGTVVPFDRSGVEPPSSPSDTDLSVTPAVPPQRVIEDPLILNSPQVSIPKKNEPVFKRNRGIKPIKFPSESVIYLERWHLMKGTKGLYVEGIHREEGIQWNSNIVVDRVSTRVLKTVSGRVYILVGKMALLVETGFPKWLLKRFAHGFPANWKKLYEKFLSESKKETTRNRERGATAKPKSEASVSHSVKRHQKNPVKTPDSCLPASSSSSKVSRSGRLIKAPLEYWKGGRVTLDSQMNVTIHECYEPSIIYPEVTKPASAGAFRKPACAYLPRSGGLKQSDKASEEKTTAPLRKVKAPVQRRNKAKVIPERKPCHSPKASRDALTSSEEHYDINTRSRQRHSAAPRKQSKPEKSSARREHEKKKPSLRLSDNMKSPDISVREKTPTGESSNEDLIIRRKRWSKRGHGDNGDKLRPSRISEESETDLRRRTRDAAQKPAKHKRRERTKPVNKSTRSATERKGNATIPPERDDDKWTEAEITRLQEAVGSYPKHINGYWEKVARSVGTRSAEECYSQHTSQETSRTPAKRAKKKNVEAPKPPVTAYPVISARVGTLKRKQQVRHFLETMPRENVEDVFSSEYMQSKRFEIPSMCPSEDHDFAMSDLEPTTPMSNVFPEAKTPQCLHITPRMMGSPNRSNDDKYVFQLQKRMKMNRFNVCKPAPPTKSFSPTPSVKRTLRRCVNTENDNFVVWEMFPGNNGALPESGEEEDFYFSDND